MPKFEYPRFYIKAVGGSFSIEHRLTHSYMLTVNTEEELVAEIKKLNAMPEEEFWRYMIFERKIRIPSTNQSVLSKATKENESSEEWFRDAWSVYTDLFYTKNSRLLIEEKELPMQVINKLRREQYDKEKALAQKQNDERIEAERLERENERIIKRQVRKENSTKEPEATGKLGSVASLERLGKKKKKLIKKVKVKTESDSVFEILDTDDPFA